MMYAIVEINGQQFKAEAGQKLFVHHIEGAENGSTVEFEKVLLVDKDGNVTVGAPIVEGAKVVCQVVSNLVKGDKVLVFHKKRRKGYRKLGHRCKIDSSIKRGIISIKRTIMLNFIQYNIKGACISQGPLLYENLWG